MRVILAVIAALAVCACNWVVTKAPLFGPADAARAAKLRPGVWSAGASSDCKFDERAPITTWPDCAGRLVIRGDRWVTLDKKDGRWVWTNQPALLTGGTPQILQTPPNADAKTSDAGYSYYGLLGKTHDRSGRVTAFTVWPVLCGPPAPKAPGDEPSPPVHPFPGITMDLGDSDCTTTSREALRSAADASRLWADTALTAHWVRAGDR